MLQLMICLMVTVAFSFTAWYYWPRFSHSREMQNPLKKAEAEFRLMQQSLNLDRQRTEIDLLRLKTIQRDEAILDVANGAVYQGHALLPIRKDEAILDVSHGTMYQNHVTHQIAQGTTQLELAAPIMFIMTWLDALVKQAKSLHMILYGSRNSGKSTVVNYLMNEYFISCGLTLVDPLFNEVDSGWILPRHAVVSKDFVGAVTNFHESHQKLVSLTTTSRQGQGRKILIIDEAPALLNALRVNDKQTYNKVMSMFRAIYSNGSHTNHNLILLSQTVLCEDLDLSSNDKGNFIQICLGSLSGDYLALRRGKANKKKLYERLAACTEEHEFYATYEDYKGIIDINPLPDLSKYGAKRLYEQSNNFVPRNENSVPAAVPQSSQNVPIADLGRFEGRKKEIAQHIVDGKTKTWIRDNVTGRNETVCKEYDEVYAELYPSWDLSTLIAKKGGQQS